MAAKNHFAMLFLLFLAVSCNSISRQTASTDSAITIRLTDSAKDKMVDTIDSAIESNASPNDTTLSARFIRQETKGDGNVYITVQANDSILTLINLLPLKDDEISKLKKRGNNITLI
ncbi:MAG TPA: hypothetical protein VG890_15975 [Puia sp.]|nr:hypothetical protein [Puia sp.]